MSVDVNYYSFSPLRADKQWIHFIEDLSILRKKKVIDKEDESIDLNKRQERLLDSDPPVGYLIYENKLNTDQLMHALKNLDIYYGSVTNDCFESSVDEYPYFEALMTVYNINIANDIPTRDDWIRIFQDISIEKIKEVSERLVNKFNLDKNYAEWEIVDYLRCVRTIIKDLKENSDSIFIRSFDQGDGGGRTKRF